MYRAFFLLLCALFSCGITNVEAQPLMGWSSWNTYRVNISDSLIRAQADAMIRLGLHECGYNYINIDDGFFGYRDSSGIMHTHPERFPNGLLQTANYIHNLGLKAGIYSDAGYVTCGSIYDNDKNGVGAGLLGHVEQDAELYFNRWGFDFIKIDYCGAGTELELDEKETYTNICKTIMAVSQHPVKINICRWAFPGVWAADVAGSWRISSDIRAKWSSVKRIIEKNLYLSAFVSDGHYNDMDMLEVGRGLKADEEDTHFAMWCVMSSPLLIGCDLTKLPARSLALLKNTELIAVNQDTLGLQAHVVKRCGEGFVLAKDVKERYGTTRVVAFYNPSDAVCDFKISLRELLLEGKTKVRDLMTHTDLPPITKGEISLSVAPHGTRVLLLDAKRRVEAERYEAEWAFLPCYNDLGKQKKPIHHAAESAASGGVVVRNIGGKAENMLRWNDVYSFEGGKYMLEIRYLPGKNRKMSVLVNGDLTQFDNIPEEGSIQSVSLPVTLRKGENTIEIASILTWAPDIDCIRLTKANEKHR